MTSIEEMAHIELTNLFNQLDNMEINLVKVIVDYICTEVEHIETWYSYDPNHGYVERYYTRFGLKEGTQEEFRIKDGTLLRTCEYLKGKRHGWTRNYHNGKLCKQCHFEEDQLSGSYLCWYDDYDQLRIQGSYCQGEMDGERISWHPNGTLRSLEIYKNGTLVPGTGKAWYSDGTVKSYNLFLFETVSIGYPLL